MKPFSSLFARILLWFFLNLTLVSGVLIIFFWLQSHTDLYTFLQRQTSDRMRMAAGLIAHDLSQAPRTSWPEILARHGKIYQVGFALVLEFGELVRSQDLKVPPQRGPEHPGAPRLMMRTKNPTRYWVGIPIPLFSRSFGPPMPAMLLAVSNSITGNGFFFDPTPWIIVAAAVIAISVLSWIPLVRNITHALARMTRAAEDIARGRFDVRIHEPRADEIGRLGSAINHMTSRMHGFVKGQKRFLGDVAHELGSPIARIQLGLGILERSVNPDNRKRVADVIEDVSHMSDLVNELLSFSRAEMNPSKVRLETTALFPLVQRAVQRDGTPETEINMKVHPDIRVLADPELLTRALANLIRNAVKYAGSAGSIYVSAERKKDKVMIEVRDAGDGVPEDLVDRLFEPFFRPEPSRDRDSGGVGLGLAIVKTCIDACNGTVSARNLTPRGFAVSIALAA
jgi:two-component system sensor histidine kinase CpxA